MSCRLYYSFTNLTLFVIAVCGRIWGKHSMYFCFTKKVYQTFLHSGKLESGGGCLSSISFWQIRRKLEVQSGQGGKYYPFNTKTFSTRPHYPLYWNSSLRPVCHTQKLVTLPCHNVFPRHVFCSLKDRNAVLPHPGPPRFETETWGYLNSPLVYRRTDRPVCRRLCHTMALIGGENCLRSQEPCCLHELSDVLAWWAARARMSRNLW